MMSVLILSSLLLVFACAWFLARPFRVDQFEQEGQAQQAQYVLARERLLQQLEQIEVQQADGLLEEENARSETARLEYELAGIMKRIELADDAQRQPVTAGETSLRSWLAWAGFSLFLLTGTFVLYGAWQAETWLTLANSHQEQIAPATPLRPQPASVSASRQPSTTVPPEALAMVARLEGKLAKNPDDGEGWKRLGRSYLVMGRYQEAVSAYSSAAALLPNDTQIGLALQELADIASRGGRHPQAAAGQQVQAARSELPEPALERILQLEERVAAKPDEAMSWARLGRAYLNVQRESDAERAYARAYALAPKNIVILASYAGLVFAKNPRDPQGKALGLFKQLYALDPEHPDGLWFLGLAAYSEGNLERTIELWTKLLGILPPETESYASVRTALAKVEMLSNNSE